MNRPVQPQKRRRSLLFWGTILGGLVVAALGYRWGHARKIQSQAIAGLPSRISVPGNQRLLAARISEAEDDVRHSADPIGGLQLLGEVYYANGYSDAAIQVYGTLQRLQPDQPRWSHLLATLLAGFGRLDEAIPLLQKVVQGAPGYLPARIRLADALMKTNRVSESRVAYQEILSRDPRNLYAFLGLARCEIEIGHRDLAEVNLQKAVQINPRFSAAWELLAGLAEQRGDETSAASARVEGSKGQRFQDTPDPWVDELLEECFDPYRLRVAAATEENSGDTAAALRTLEHALRLTPDDAAIHRGLGQIYLGQNSLGVARTHLEKAVALNPDDSANWVEILKLEKAANDRVARSRAILAGLSHCPNSPSLHLEHGRQLLAEHDMEGAMTEFKEARQLRPNDPDAIVEMAVAYLYSGNMTAGMEQMKEVLGVQPDHPLALLALARNAIESGKASEAERWIQRLRSVTGMPPADVEDIVGMYQERFGRAP